MGEMSGMDMEREWNRIAAHIQRNQTEDDCSIHYGPWAPPEAELRLLSTVDGQHVLELGCGTGECSTAFAQAGAKVTALDLSEVQLNAARRLATTNKVEIDFIHAGAEDLSALDDKAFSLIFANYTLPYIHDLSRAFAECRRVLSPGGRVVFSLDHPMRDCFYDAMDDEMVIYPTRGYLAEASLQWTYAGTDIAMQSRHISIGGWIDLIHRSGLQLERLVEPAPPIDLLDEIWPADGPHAPLRNLPQMAIFIARKPVYG